MSSSSSFQPLLAPSKKPDFAPLGPEEASRSNQFQPLFAPPAPERPEADADTPASESDAPVGAADEQPAAGDAGSEEELVADSGEESDRSSVADRPDTAGPPPNPVAEAADPRDMDAELLRLSEEAREAGHRVGLQEGLDGAAGTVQAAEALLEELTSLRRRLLERSVQDVADAARLVAHRIVGRELLVAAGDVQALVQDVLSTLGEEDEILLVVSPEDDLALREAYPTLLKRFGRDATLRIETSPEVSQGGVRVETAHGNVDATVDARFEAFAESIDAWARERVEGLDA